MIKKNICVNSGGLMMKKIFNVGFIGVILIMGFTVIDCDNETITDGKDKLPTLTGIISINGTAQEGEILTADVSGVNGNGIPTYQWIRGASTDIGINQNKL
jgi:hypothetical protein